MLPNGSEANLFCTRTGAFNRCIRLSFYLRIRKPNKAPEHTLLRSFVRYAVQPALPEEALPEEA